MPPLLLDVVDTCPEMTKWKTRDDEPSLSGIRDRVLLLVGFVSLRASNSPPSRSIRSNPTSGAW